MTTSHSNAPAHYSSEIPPRKAIRAWGLGFELGNVVKYVARAGKKPGESRLKDLNKALDYLLDEIEHEKKSVEQGYKTYSTAGYGNYRIPESMYGEFDYDHSSAPGESFLEKWKDYKVSA